jgi:hypothetical protein
MQEAHKSLLQAMSDLDELTRGPLPLKERIIDARWKISRASLARRTLWNAIYAHLSRDPCRDTGNAVHSLQEADTALLRSSSEHIRKWNINTIMQDWPAYCEASKALRLKMKAAIEVEKRLLYMVLETD